jgi:hypothetical protein
VAPRGDLGGRRWAAVVVGLVGCVLLAGACSSSRPGRPHTSATLQILAPAPNTVTGPDVDVRLVLAHAQLVPPTQVGGKIEGDRGHIHISVDGVLESMALQLNQSIPDLTPGIHTIQAEFVASDHLPFKNRVVAAVTFRVT